MSTPFSRASRWRTGAVISVIGAAFYSLPMLIHVTGPGPIIDSAKPLKPDAIRRGAFNNSGSRDIGPDPDWVDGVRRTRPRKRSANNPPPTLE